jgi:hypothetical protein
LSSILNEQFLVITGSSGGTSHSSPHMSRQTKPRPRTGDDPKCEEITSGRSSRAGYESRIGRGMWMIRPWLMNCLRHILTRGEAILHANSRRSRVCNEIFIHEAERLIISFTIEQRLSRLSTQFEATTRARGARPLQPTMTAEPAMAKAHTTFLYGISTTPHDRVEVLIILR